MSKHTRSLEAKNRRQETRDKKELARSIVSNFSIYCKENGEKVFAAETEPVVREKLTFAFGFLPNWATNREYGEVLNRHPVKVHSMTVRWGY